MFKFIILVISYLGLIVAQENWSANNYPNPLAEYFSCNANFQNGPNRVCDPDRIFTDEERSRLNDALNGLEAKTGETNTNDCSRKGITAVAVLANKIRGGSSRDASNMANGLLNKWTFDHCGKGIVILLSKEDKKFWTAKNSKVPVDGKVFTEIFNQQA